MTLQEFREVLHQQGETWETVVRCWPTHKSGRMNQCRREQEAENRRLRGIIDSMTPEERDFPFVRVDGWRVRRIARGAGVDKSEVVELLAAVKEVNVMVARARLGQVWPFGSGDVPDEGT